MVELLLQAGLFGDQGVEIGVRLGELVVDLVEARQQIHDGLDRFFDHLLDGLSRVELRLLVEHADRYSPLRRSPRR